MVFCIEVAQYFYFLHNIKVNLKQISALHVWGGVIFSTFYQTPWLMLTFSSLPDADILILVGQMLTAHEVVSLNSAHILTKEVLGASFGSQIVEATAVLGHLEKEQNMFIAYGIGEF